MLFRSKAVRDKEHFEKEKTELNDLINSLENCQSEKEKAQAENLQLERNKETLLKVKKQSEEVLKEEKNFDTHDLLFETVSYTHLDVYKRQL